MLGLPDLPRISALAAALLLAFAVGCGDSDTANDDSSAIGKETLVDFDELPSEFVDDADIEGAEPGSAESAFLSYWSSLQFRDWASAANTYEPELVRLVTPDEMIESLQVQGALFRGTKPGIVEALTEGDVASIRYAIRDPNGETVVNTAVLRDSPDGWRIVFDSFLTGALQSHRQTEVQTGIDPTAPNPSQEAIRAGERAARIPTAYLARQELPLPVQE